MTSEAELLAEFSRIQAALAAAQKEIAQLNKAKELDASFFKLEEGDSRSLPEFRGEPQLLPHFIKSCDKLVADFYVGNTPNHIQNTRLLRGILGKIKDTAQLQISNFDFSHWAEVKAKLLVFWRSKNRQDSVH